MNQYNIIVQQLLAYLTKRKQCSSSRLSHKQCYEEFANIWKRIIFIFLKKQQTNGLQAFRGSIIGKSVISGGSISVN